MNFKEFLQANFDLPKGSEGEIFLSVLVLCFATGFAALISWLFRRDVRSVEVKERVLQQNFTDVELGYLLAGPMRAIEVTLFLLARTSWVSHDGSGRFMSQMDDLENRSGDNLPPLQKLELEMMRRLVDRGPSSLDDLLRVPFKELEVLHEQLCQQGLLLSHSDFRLGSILAIAPLLMVGAYFFIRLIFVLQSQSSDHTNPVLAAMMIGLMAVIFLVFDLKNSFGRRTSLGDEFENQLRRQWLRRRQENKRGANRIEERIENRQGEVYDVMWAMKDDVLFSGLRALAGTQFAPLATFSPLAAERSYPLEPAPAKKTGTDSN